MSDRVCDGTKTTLMMVDSRKDQQVVQLVGPVLRGRSIVRSSAQSVFMQNSVIEGSDKPSVGPGVDYS